jgi:cyclic pyranopterin phosphate synthase
VKETLTHVSPDGSVRMVDVGDKPITKRRAVAEAQVRMQPATCALLRSGNTPKGDVLAAVRIAAIQAAKRTAELIPLCHPLPIGRIDVAVEIGESEVVLRVEVLTEARTGVEMEALTGASVGALTLYDMLKAIDRGMTFEVSLQEKDGGASGPFRREPAP